jgi:hypothetical protein
MTEAERNAMFDTCFEYDDHLRANGHFAGAGVGLVPLWFSRKPLSHLVVFQGEFGGRTNERG